MARKLTFLLILNLTALALFLVTSAEKHTENVWPVRLRHCYLDCHANIHALALACLGVDYIRLWSLPVEGPRWEPDPFGDKPPPDAAGASFCRR